MRRSIRVLSVALLAAIFLAACAGQAAGPVPRNVVVTGTGTVTVKPDIAVVNLGVQTQGPDIAEAVQENNRRAQSVMDSLRTAGIAQEDIRTTNFFVSNQAVMDTTGTPTGQLTYTVDNTITFTLRKPDDLGKVLQGALVAGANNVQGVSYSVADPSAAMDEARKKAMQDAKQQAEQLAASAGAQLGEVLSIGEGGGVVQPYYGAPAFGKGGGGGAVPVESGTLDYQSTVTVSYRLK